MIKRAQELIKILALSPHPEGGYYKEIYRSKNKIISPKNNEIRSAVTDIYFLLFAGQVSRLHKVAHDEIWHFYEGDPLALVEIEADNLQVARILLGDKNTVPKYQHCIEGGNWQGAYSSGDYSLVGCTVAPGFDFSDFEFLKDNQSMCADILAKKPLLSRLV